VGDIGLIVTEFDASLDTGFDTKFLAQDHTTVTYVSLFGTTGYWFSGAPHVYSYLDEIAGQTQWWHRAVARVLVWQVGRVVYRVESPFGLERTLSIARSLR
jgi:hypothetical protein